MSLINNEVIKPLDEMDTSSLDLSVGPLDENPLEDNNEPKANLYFTLVSSDQVEFKNIPSRVCKLSRIINNMIDLCIDLKKNNEQHKIPILNVSGNILKKIIKWMQYHIDNPPKKIEKPVKTKDLLTIACEWDVQFIDVDNDTLIELMNASNYMDITDLLDLCCAKLATIIKGKSPEEIRKTLNIENDFTPEEEAELRKKLPL